jgi:VWFA-related protein
MPVKTVVTTLCLLLSVTLQGQLRIPDQRSEPLFKGPQGKQRTEVHYDPASDIVTVKLAVQDPNGYFIPNIRPESVAVYENGTRQNVLSMNVEHAPVALALLLEHGGRRPSLNREVTDDISMAGHQLVQSLGHDDSVGIWTYAGSVRQLIGFTRDHGIVDHILLSLRPPDVSETNLYDALIAGIRNMRPVSGRKALVVVTSCRDTFSKARYEDVLDCARGSDTPVYVISMVPAVESEVKVLNEDFKTDWKSGERKLQEIASASGGRLYSPETMADVSPAADNLIENLKTRYVITYRSSDHSDRAAPRRVRIELIEPRTGKRLQITDASGRLVNASPIAEASYIPAQSVRSAR